MSEFISSEYTSPITRRRKAAKRAAKPIIKIAVPMSMVFAGCAPPKSRRCLPPESPSAVHKATFVRPPFKNHIPVYNIRESRNIRTAMGRNERYRNLSDPIIKAGESSDWLKGTSAEARTHILDVSTDLRRVIVAQPRAR
ncbi:hypothetical protein EYF80_030200 [Liparis tanakae]|uniref:Uncharacterized protein n=1 Tax=Liparis tanakae TaxID=230148 RepID=A0A4Z2H262_9TELE|nr:hypothetical protein EYF80_030200 [Liparis tanakae]